MTMTTPYMMSSILTQSYYKYILLNVKPVLKVMSSTPITLYMHKDSEGSQAIKNKQSPFNVLCKHEHNSHIVHSKY